MEELQIGAEPPDRAAMRRIGDRIRSELRHDLTDYYAEIGKDWRIAVDHIVATEPTRAAANARAFALATSHKHNPGFLKKCLRVAEYLPDLLEANAEAQAADYDSVYVYEPDRSLDNLKWLKETRAAPARSDFKRNAQTQSISSDTTTFVPKAKVNLICGDARTELAAMPDGSATGSLTSVPYHALRHYMDDPRHIGAEPTVKEWLAALVAVYHELLRVLKPGALAFIVVGDRYASGSREIIIPRRGEWINPHRRPAKADDELPGKNLMMLPFRLASALQDDGWCLREVMIWDKGQALGTSFASDRPDIIHEYILMLCKPTPGENHYNKAARLPRMTAFQQRTTSGRRWGKAADKNITSVLHVLPERAIKWSAPFPVALARPLLKIMDQPNAHIIDPFGGTGTTAIAAIELAMDVTLVELNPEFCQRTETRLAEHTAPRHLHKPFVRSGITLHHGDGLDVLRRMKAASVQLMLADPPYGITELDWDVPLVWDLWVPEIWRVLADDGTLIVHCKQPSATDIMVAFRRQFRMRLAWINPRPSHYLQSARRPLSEVEDILVFSRSARYTYNAQTRTRDKPTVQPMVRRVKPLATKPLLAHNGNKRQDLIYPRELLEFAFDERDATPGLKTPTKKPVGLEVYLVEMFSNAGDLVLDFCSGYASSALAAITAGRRYIGIERHAPHFIIGRDRCKLALRPSASIRVEKDAAD